MINIVMILVMIMKMLYCKDSVPNNGNEDSNYDESNNAYDKRKKDK